MTDTPDPSPAEAVEAFGSVYGQLMVLTGRLSEDQMSALRELDGLLAAAEHVLAGTPVGAGAHSTICGMIMNAYAAGAVRATAEPRWHCTADPATVPCGRCVACRCDHVDAYQAGAAAQREAGIKLAIHHRVFVRIRHNDDGTVTWLNRGDWYPFADLLGGTP